MNETIHSEQPCELACPPDGCAVHTAGAPIVLAEALARFNREAKRAVCNTGRYRIPYFVSGQGPPLVFVHRVGDANISIIPPIQRLSADFRCCAYHPPGSP